jgi:hypothetical protein
MITVFRLLFFIHLEKKAPCFGRLFLLKKRRNIRDAAFNISLLYGLGFMAVRKSPCRRVIRASSYDHLIFNCE